MLDDQEPWFGSRLKHERFPLLLSVQNGCVQWLLGGVLRLRTSVKSAEVKNECSYTSASPIYLYGGHRDSFLYQISYSVMMIREGSSCEVGCGVMTEHQSCCKRHVSASVI